MLTYRVRPHIFRIAEESKNLSFPGSATVNLHFQPPQPFGTVAGGGRTAIRAVKAQALFNANTGQHSITSATPLTSLHVRITEPARVVTLDGTRLTVVQDVDSLGSLQQLIESLYYALPMLLAVEFADPPYVARIDGAVGGVPFRWELAEWKAHFWPTTQEEQERAVARAWERLGDLSHPERRRLLAALHYLHVAERLLAVGVTPGEFLAEAILNFSKVLEALFPPSSRQGTMDAARTGLAALGYCDTEIEARFVPAIVLRNHIDVGHVDLTLFKTSQLTVLHQYAESAEGHFKALFHRIFERLAAGTFDIAPGLPQSASSDDQAVVDRVSAAMARDNAA